MVLQLYLWILFYILLAGGGVYGVRWAGKKLLRKRELTDHQLQGNRNARLLKAKMEEVCSFCDKPTDPDRDAYEPGTGWYHSRCMKRLLNG